MSALTFAAPSYRAAASDLTVSISPLGLVELSDEEFEVHGPRMTRYATNWAFYLGHHWAYRREAGEPQITFNYVKAFADYINNFTFGRGVEFRTAKETEHIVPSLLKRVWTQDNSKEQLLWEMGNQGGVSGDCFVKVAWEPPPVGLEALVKGKVRILVMNAAFCFPEWHPHDRNRLVRFKLKYRFWGNTAEGTRTVMTYTEIITDELIQEFLNDELIDERPNILGVIPIVHIANTPVSSSPWGLADIQDIIPLNRLYNEISTSVTDIINYHAEPVTIITGAKSQNLEKGAKKIWGGLPEKANVFNLEGGTAAIPAAMTWLEQIKRSMHEITGVPESALGQMQPISNTSGVALSIMYQPMMQRYNLKKLQYTVGIKKINTLTLLTLANFSPQDFTYDPSTEGVYKEGQPLQLDLQDPLTYETTIHWPPPLPVDALIKLQEGQMKMLLGIESKRGLLRELGIEFPDEKLLEIDEELWEEAQAQGALQMKKNQQNSVILATTGLPPEGTEAPAPQTDADGAPINPPQGPQGVEAPDLSQVSMDAGQQMFSQLVTQAYGTKVPLRRQPDNDPD